MQVGRLVSATVKVLEIEGLHISMIKDGAQSLERKCQSLRPGA